MSHLAANIPEDKEHHAKLWATPGFPEWILHTTLRSKKYIGPKRHKYTEKGGAKEPPRDVVAQHFGHFHFNLLICTACDPFADSVPRSLTGLRKILS